MLNVPRIFIVGKIKMNLDIFSGKIKTVKKYKC